jgi:diguanylate cyclase (GGDEF)-like protein
MENYKQFLRLILDSLSEQIVVIESNGNIIYVNHSWNAFGDENECNMLDGWQDVNYLDECEKAALLGEELGLKAAKGIRKVIAKEQESFYLEYPCHSPTEKRWFMMRVTTFLLDNTDYFVVSHQNITERKLAEERVAELALADGLTAIPNRHHFDEFIKNELMRSARTRTPVCLAIVDIDNFKLINDTYGHLCGDECLIKVGKLLKRYARRPSDLCARYGGDEFVIAWGNLPLASGVKLINKFLSDIAALNIEHILSPAATSFTVSIGIAELIPHQKSKACDLIANADEMLLRAKRRGRNRLEY